MSTAPHAIEPLLAALADRSLTTDERAALADLLRDDPQARALYRRYIRIHLLLDLETGAANASDTSATADTAPIATITPTAQSPAPRPFPLVPIAASAIAAAVLIAGVVALYVFVIASPDVVDDPQIEAVPLATLIDSTGTVIVNNDSANPGREYAAGDYAIDDGSAQFLLTNNVGVVLRGETRLTLHDTMHATLTRGTATFRCPPAAKGFVVDLPGRTRVTDLGTEFAVHIVDGGAREVYVIDGLIELAADDGSVQNLTAGEGYRVDTDGAVTALTRHAIVETFGAIAISLDEEGRAILDREPVALWAMTGPDAVAVDFVANEVAEASGVSFADPTVNADSFAAKFDGTGAIELGRRNDLMLDAPMTFEARVWLEPGTAKQRLFSVDRGTPNDRIGWGVAFEQVPGGYKPFFTHYRVLDYRFDTVVPAGRWVRLAYLVDDNTISLYIDGEHAGTQPRAGSMLTGPATAYIGRLDDNTEHFRGRLTHVAVYDRLLNPDEIEEHLTPGELP